MVDGEIKMLKLGNNGAGPLIIATRTKYGWTKPATVMQTESGEFQLTGLVDLVDHYGEFQFPEVMFTGDANAAVLESYERFFTEVIKPTE